MLTRLAEHLAGGIWAVRGAPAGAAGNVIVLTYHDLRGASDPPSWLRVEVGAFERQLRLIGECGRFLSPADMHDPGRSASAGVGFLVTFDDGYRNQLDLALPVLERLGIPGLFFVSTHHVVTGEAYWFDRVIESLRAASPGRLDLSPVGLGALRLPHPGTARWWSRVQMVLEAYKRLGNPGDACLESALGHLETQAPARGDGRFRPLGADELRRLAGSPFCHLGSHAHRHVILTGLTDEALAQELAHSKAYLESAAGRPVDAIAYPNGNCDDRVAAASRAAGYRTGYGVVPGAYDSTADRYRIPRVGVGGYDTARQVAGRIARLLGRRA